MRYVNNIIHKETVQKEDRIREEMNLKYYTELRVHRNVYTLKFSIEDIRVRDKSKYIKI